MNKEDILKRVNDVFKEVFERDTVCVDFETTANDVDGWDSLKHITLIEAIEDEFEMRFKMNEVTGMQNVGEMIDIILERI